MRTGPVFLCDDSFQEPLHTRRCGINMHHLQHDKGFVECRIHRNGVNFVAHHRDESFGEVAETDVAEMFADVPLVHLG